MASMPKVYNSGMFEQKVKYYCRICGTEITPNNRIRSHILTESTYYVSGGEYMVLGNRVIDAKKRSTEKNLLCKECDYKIGRWEQERNEMFTSDGSRPTGPQRAQPAILGYGFNNEQIILACLADIFRCSISTLEPYSGIYLGEKHEQRIREILFRGFIEDCAEYPVVIGRYSSEERVLDSITQVPSKMRLGGVMHYQTFLPGGWSWIVRVSKQSFPLIDAAAVPIVGAIPVLNFGNAKSSNLYGIASKAAVAIAESGYFKK